VEGVAGIIHDAMFEAWKDKFFQAMIFREKTEQEKEELRRQLSGFEEELKKKERMLQSSKMIIKFRESTIAKLEKSGKTADETNAKLAQDAESMKTAQH
jgi:cell division septum initiation protein DivIVA